MLSPAGQGVEPQQLSDTDAWGDWHTAADEHTGASLDIRGLRAHAGHETKWRR